MSEANEMPVQNYALTCDQAQDLLAWHTLELLGAMERDALEAHLASCVACAVEAAKTADVLSVMAYAVPAREVSAASRDKLFARVARSAPAKPDPSARPVGPAPSPRGRGLERVLVACSLLLAVGLTGSLWQLGQTQAQLASASQRAAASEATATQLQQQQVQQAAYVTQDADFLASKDVKMVQMEPKGMAGAQAWVYWSEAHHAWLVTFRGLPAPGPTKTYQLWAVTSNAKVSLGTFAADANGVARVRAQLPADGKPMACAVTVEPSGGRPAPTGPLVMVGPIKQL